MSNRNDHYVLWFYLNHCVVFDYSKFTIELPEATTVELERIQCSNLYRDFENDLTAVYCKVFGIYMAVLNASLAWNHLINSW